MSDTTDQQIDLLRRIVAYDIYRKTGQYAGREERTPPPFHPDVESAQQRYDLKYLRDHGYIAKHCVYTALNGSVTVSLPVEPTVAGIDLVSPDGGLTGYRKRLEIEMEMETFRGLLIAASRESSADETQKASLIKRINSASGAALKVAATEVLKAGLHKGAESIPWHVMF